MSKATLRWIALPALAAAVFGLAAPVAAGAAPRATDPSFVGTYKVKFEPPGGTKFLPGGSFTLKANGTTAGDGMRGGHWSNAGKRLTIVLPMGGHTARLIATQTKTDGLGTKERPGEETVDGSPNGVVWYATRSA